MAAIPPPLPAGWLDRDLKLIEAVITQHGRWSWRVYIRHGISISAPGGYGWIVFGRRRAERKAARELARYVQERQRKATTHVVASHSQEAN